MSVLNDLLYMHIYNQAIVAVVMVALYLNRNTRVQGAGFWVANLLLYSVSLVFNLRYQQTGVLSMALLYYASQVVQMMLFILGFRAFLRLRIRWVWVLGVTAAMLLLLCAIFFIDHRRLQLLFAFYCLGMGIWYLLVFSKGIRQSLWVNHIFKLLFFLYCLLDGVFLFNIITFITGVHALLNHMVRGSAIAILTVVNYVLILLVNNELLFRRINEGLRREREMKVLKVLSEADSLTGLYNRRSMEEHLALLIDEAEETGKPLALFILDIDEFKKINDTYGHDAGDRVLKAYAASLRNCMREDDTAARWGGDEFMVISRGTDSRSAGSIHERLIQPVPVEGIVEAPLQVSLSCGYALFVTGDTVTTITKRADLMLYEQKRGGRG